MYAEYVLESQVVGSAGSRSPDHTTVARTGWTKQNRHKQTTSPNDKQVTAEPESEWWILVDCPVIIAGTPHANGDSDISSANVIFDVLFGLGKQEPQEFIALGLKLKCD